MKRTILPLCAVFLAACAGPGKLSLRPGYDFKTARRVAVLPFADPKNMPGTGGIVADRIARTLSDAGLTVTGGAPVVAALRKLDLVAGERLVTRDLERLGAVLEVDAVVFGRLLARIKPEKTTLRSPRGNILVRRSGRLRQVPLREPRRPGDVKLYETEGDVSLDFVARMARVGSGEVMWIAAAAAEKRGLEDALDAALDSVLDTLRRRVKRSLKGKAPVSDDFTPEPVLRGWEY